MVESTEGLVPEGWEVVKVKDAVFRLAANRHYEQADVASIGAVPVVDQSRGQSMGFPHNVPDYRATPQDSTTSFGDHTCKMCVTIDKCLFDRPECRPVQGERERGSRVLILRHS